jgi:hypothetical protein
MSLHVLEPPEAAIAALKSMIGAHLSRTAIADYSKSFTWELRAPVFVSDQVNALSVGDLDHFKPATASIWRFILRHEGIPFATGDVTRTVGPYQLSLVSTNEGRALALVSAIERAADALAKQEGSDAHFELRIFEAPAFHFRALWLSSHIELFVILQEGSLSSNTLLPAALFIEHFNNLRSAKLKNLVYLDYDKELTS